MRSYLHVLRFIFVALTSYLFCCRSLWNRLSEELKNEQQQSEAKEKDKDRLQLDEKDSDSASASADKSEPASPFRNKRFAMCCIIFCALVVGGVQRVVFLRPSSFFASMLFAELFCVEVCSCF